MFFRSVSDAVRHVTGHDCFAAANSCDDVIDHVILTTLRHSLVFIKNDNFSLRLPVRPSICHTVADPGGGGQSGHAPPPQSGRGIQWSIDSQEN